MIVVPADYTPPSFPSLYDPVFSVADPASYIYRLQDAWRFTLYWTLIIFGAAHMSVAICAFGMQWRQWRIMWAVPVVYGFIGCVEAILAGSIVGLIVGAIYQAGNFTMSTWIPLIWAAINTLVIILSSFPMHGAL